MVILAENMIWIIKKELIRDFRNLGEESSMNGAKETVGINF